MTLCSIGFNGIHELAEVCTQDVAVMKRPPSYLAYNRWEETEESKTLVALEQLDLFNGPLSDLLLYQTMSDDSMLWHYKKQLKGRASSTKSNTSECPGKWTASVIGASTGTLITISGSGGGYQGILIE
jgi:hypothetical protein